MESPNRESSEVQADLPKPETRNLKPEDDDLDEEVSWQAMARATLKDEKKSEISSQKSVVRSQKSEEKPYTQPPSPIAYHPSPTTETRNPKPETPSTTEFVQEELPPDFWDREAVPVEVYRDEDIERPEAKTVKPKTTAASPIHHPLFAELQSLFPGRIVRLEVAKTDNKPLEDKEEIEAPPSDTLVDESDA